MCCATAAQAQSYDLSWFSIDGGGNPSSAGSFDLSGTVGQPDAGASMTGNGFELTGGFWTIAADQVSGCGSADFNCDGDTGTDSDIEAFFACLAGNCCALCGSADFNGDGDIGTDADIESFFRVLAGGPC